MRKYWIAGSRSTAVMAACTVLSGLVGCSVEGRQRDIGSSGEPVINRDQYLYLQCNSTDLVVSEKSRLQSTRDPNVFELAINVTQSWTLSDQCIFTLVSTGQPDSWGTAQSNYTDSRPSTAVLVPGGDIMVGSQPGQANFSVKYPALGPYLATVDWVKKTFAIAPSDAGPARGDTLANAAPADATIESGPDATAESGADTAEADAGPGVSVDSGATTEASQEATPDAGPGVSVDSGAATEASQEATTDAGPGVSVDSGAAAEASPEATTEADADFSDASVDSGDAGGGDALDATTDADTDALAEAAADAAEAAPYVPPTGGYSIQCPWLLDTSSMITHLLRSADFYVNVADPQFGGFFTFLDQTGNPKSTNKSFQVQSRDAYAFVHAFMVSGDESYLAAGRQALDFLYAHGWDANNGGFVFLGDQQGNWLPAPSGVPSDKWSFTQHYALAGPTAMCEATGNATDCATMNSGMQLLETHYWDSTHGGYFNNANLNYSSVWEKGFTPTIDGITPHVLLTYLITQSAAYRTRLVSLADDAAIHLIGNMTAPGVVFGFPESFNADWSIETGSTYGFVGHLYKTAWALARAYLVTGDPKYRDAARQLVMQLWAGGGFDHANGAPNFDYNFKSGVGSTNKEYWQLEQGFTSGITNWYVATNDSDRAIYIEQADRSLCFFMRHMPDAQFGGIFFETNTDGSSLIGDGSDSATDKGDQWEGSYHNVELSYYSYVYGNLFLWRRPVTLYYRFDATTQDRTVALTPLEIENGALVITGVALAGRPYADFTGTARTLHMPAGTGGVFAVTYAHSP